MSRGLEYLRDEDEDDLEYFEKIRHPKPTNEDDVSIKPKRKRPIRSDYKNEFNKN